MLSINGLSFSRDRRPLLNAVSATVADGEALKITGDNGGGKTTLLKLLAGLLPPDDGVIRWGGQAVPEDIDAYREQLLYVGHQNAAAGDLTPMENLQAAAFLRLRPPRQSPSDALQQAGLDTAAIHRPCRLLSAGQRRRTALARLRAFDARLWLLDEPLATLDVGGRAMMTAWLQEHLTNGGIAVITMHSAADLPLDAAVLHCHADRKAA